MPPQARIGDASLVPADSHGCPGCPHKAVGPAISGSSNVLTNGRSSVRVGDQGIHAACCGQNIWMAKAGSRSVLINGRMAHRLSDIVKHCGGTGRTIEGSPNVIVGDNPISRNRNGSVKNSWIKVKIVNHKGEPVPNEPYAIKLPDGSQYEGNTDQNGAIFISNIQPGTCNIELPNAIHHEWKLK